MTYRELDSLRSVQGGGGWKVDLENPHAAAFLKATFHINNVFMLQVSASAGLFAASHLTTVAGYLQLLLFGMMLGAGHMYCRCNLLVPTCAHAAFNCVLFLNILFS